MEQVPIADLYAHVSARQKEGRTCIIERADAPFPQTFPLTHVESYDFGGVPRPRTVYDGTRKEATRIARLMNPQAADAPWPQNALLFRYQPSHYVCVVKTSSGMLLASTIEGGDDTELSSFAKIMVFRHYIGMVFPSSHAFLKSVYVHYKNVSSPTQVSADMVVHVASQELPPTVSIVGFLALFDFIDQMRSKVDSPCTIHAIQAPGSGFPESESWPLGYRFDTPKVELVGEAQRIVTMYIQVPPHVVRAYFFESRRNDMVCFAQRSDNRIIMAIERNVSQTKIDTMMKDAERVVRSVLLSSLEDRVPTLSLDRALADACAVQVRMNHARLVDPGVGFIVSTLATFTHQEYLPMLDKAVEALGTQVAAAMLQAVQGTTLFQSLPSLALLQPSPKHCDPDFFRQMLHMLNVHMTVAFHKTIDEVGKHLDMDPECFNELFRNTLPEAWRDRLL